MDERRSTPMRILAPMALVMVAIALFLIVTGSDVANDSDSTTASESADRADDAADRRRNRQSKSERRESQLPDDVYTVKRGDTLAGIAQTTGISVERLQELNPDLDPQALVSGQRIKLKE